ncbi:hypothetical protein [Cupriavidus campinensis]
MQLTLNRSRLAIAAIAVVLSACGGDDGEPAGAGDVATGPQASDPNVLGAECLPAPVAGTSRHISASWLVPVQVDVVDVSGLGMATFDGATYPAIDVKNSANVFFGDSEQRHAVYLHAQTPLLPVGAVTYAKAGSGGSDKRYRFEYSAITLSELLANNIIPKVNASGAPVSWDNTRRARVKMSAPALAGLEMGKSKTYTMFKQAADPSGVYQPTAGGAVVELTFTYQGRENVAAPDVTYANACKVAVDVKVIDYDWRNGGNAVIQTPYRGTVWLAPNVGPVRLGLTSVEQGLPLLDLFMPAAR